jgi:hypothetical protein
MIPKSGPKNISNRPKITQNLSIEYFIQGNLIEIFYTLELLAQLTFNAKITQTINESREFEKLFETLIKRDLKKQVNENDKLIYSSIRQVIEQIQWNLNSVNIQQIPKVFSHNEQHIVISYHSSSRELCLKIKKELVDVGLKVWTDVRKISGFSREAMQNAVEKSMCVLVCVTEHYRQSIYCQIEAKYAFRRNKPIIPLIMQQDYEDPKGWLEPIMNDRVLINFMKYDFEESLNGLKNEIDLIKSGQVKSGLESFLKSNHNPCNDSAIEIREKENNVNNLASENDFEIEIDSTKTKLTVEKNLSFLSETIKNQSLENLSKSTYSALDWTEERVNEWFERNELNLLIFDHFKPCSGKILKQLYDCKLAALEFYIQPLSKIENVEFNDIMSFGACLDDLFNNKS